MAGFYDLDKQPIKGLSGVLQRFRKATPAEIQGDPVAESPEVQSIADAEPAEQQKARSIVEQAAAQPAQVDALKEQLANKPKRSHGETIAMGLMNALPALLAGAFGGSEAGASTAAMGIEMGKEQRSRESEMEKLAQQQALQADERNTAREFQAGQSALARKEGREARDFARSESRADRQMIREEKQALKEEERTIPGIGVARTAEDAKALKSGAEEKQNFDGKIQELISIREGKGGGAVLDREAVARAKQLSKDLLLSYKNMAKLGVLSQSDEKIINAIIPADPLEYNSPVAALQGQDPILNNLKKFKADSDKDFESRLQLRLKTREKQPEAAAAKSDEDMSEAELDAEIARLKGAK